MTLVLTRYSKKFTAKPKHKKEVKEIYNFATKKFRWSPLGRRKKTAIFNIRRRIRNRQTAQGL
jgi:hypothetical protein